MASDSLNDGVQFGPANPPWAHGIKRKTLSDHPPWFREHVISIVRGAFSGVPHASSTSDTENALGWRASCYWYVSRADDLYGSVIFLCDASAATSSSQDGGSICMFDTGGMWTGRIKIQPDCPPMSPDRMKVILACSRPLADWRAGFSNHLAQYYKTAVEYVLGNPPTPSVPNFPVVCASPNKSVAWTWEARIPNDSCDALVQPRRCYMDFNTKDGLSEWLERQPLMLVSIVEVTKWIAANAYTAGGFIDDHRSPTELANQFIADSFLGI